LQGGLVHNAALLLGQALSTGTEFRQAFAAQDDATRALARALRDDDAGTVCNTAFALGHYVSDPRCFITPELKALLTEALRPISSHTDPRIRKHAHLLRSKLELRAGEPTQRQHVSFRRDKSITALQGLTNIAKQKAAGKVEARRRETAIGGDDSAMLALASLASLVRGDAGQSSSLLGLASVARNESDGEEEEETSPTGLPASSLLTTSSPPRSPKAVKAASPRRGSALAPWKKAMAPSFKKKSPGKLAVEIPLHAPGHSVYRVVGAL